jgi:hypothetical protein
MRQVYVSADALSTAATSRQGQGVPRRDPDTTDGAARGIAEAVTP